MSLVKTCSVFALAMVPISARATEDALFTIAQPMELQVGQWQVHFVTYQWNVGSPWPDLMVRLTTAANVIPGEHPGENRNAANLAGFEATAPYVDMREWSVEPVAPGASSDVEPRKHYFIDTLDVTLDVTRAAKASEQYRPGRRPPTSDDPGLRAMARDGRERLSSLAAVTIECIRDNAARTYPPVRYVNLKVIGSPALSRFSKVYRTRRTLPHGSPKN